jgi:murein L,D-transpeptidase YcbB/YkuD
VTRFATHIAAGRLQPRDISRIITLEPERPPVADVLSTLSATAAVGASLARREPPHSQYRALKKALAELRASAASDDRIVVPEGAALRPGARDERVPILRARLGVIADPDGESDVYDEVLVTAVTTFQEESDLATDGIVGPRTLAALNGRSRADEIAAVEANLERWRWMPRDLGRFHVMVNVPEFMVRVAENGSPVHETRVIVGKPGNPTPTFSHVMDHLVVNPFWNVPTSIVSNEMLPEIRQNPSGYFSRRGYQVLARVGGKYRVVDPGYIDWYSVNPRSVSIRQVPGDFNALGRIKFMFPNQHSVYLHDTPTKKLFERDVRAFSHGCVRVDQPLAFADAILPVAAPEWNSARLEKLYGGREQRINLDQPIPVHLAYFTVTVSGDGEPHYFDDIYGYDRRMAEK